MLNMLFSQARYVSISDYLRCLAGQEFSLMYGEDDNGTPSRRCRRYLLLLRPKTAKFGGALTLAHVDGGTTTPSWHQQWRTPSPTAWRCSEIEEADNDGCAAIATVL